jgi:1,2-diacylglycerol 3-alpha-glucosyltransferase
MKIGIFTDTYSPSINGIVTSIDIFREELEKKGHMVFVFCPAYKGQTRESMDKEKTGNVFRYRSVTYPLLKEYRLAIPLPAKVELIKRFNLDIIHFHTPFTMGVLASCLAKRFRIPLVQTYHTHTLGYIHYIPLPQKLMRRFAKWTTKTYCNACSLIISPSTQIKEELSSYGVTSKIVVLPTGIRHHAGGPEREAGILDRYGIGPGKKIIITVGRLGREKNYPFLLNVFARIRKESDDAVFVIAGDGPERKKLQNYAGELGILDSTMFLGSVKRSEVLELLEKSTVFVIASQTETQGLSLLEALSAGIPAVAVNALGVADILRDSHGGFLVDPDENDFTEKVLRVLSDTDLRERMSFEAKETAKRFSPNRLTDELIIHYEEASLSIRRRS